MGSYTQGLQAPQQDIDDVETLSADAIVPEDSDIPATDDLTVHDGCALARRTGLTPEQEQNRCTITTAWEMGALDAVSAFEALRLAGLLDLNLIMGLYAGYVRGLARAEAL